MMNKKTILWMILGCFCLTMMSTGANEPDIIYWSDIEKLEWSDFEGRPRYDYNQVSALTSSGIVDYKGCKDGKIIYKIRAYFEKKNSWVKKEAFTDYHLAHEQLHFDITELFARKLRKMLAQRDFKCGEEAEFEKFVQNSLEAWQSNQKNYDILTRHSMDTLAQREWMYRVNMELSLLDEFSDEETQIDVADK